MASPALPLLAILWLSVVAALAQTPCEGTPAYSPCEIPFDLPTAPPNPLTTVQLRIEFRSPHFKTYLMPAFWDGTRQKMIVRFTPTEADNHLLPRAIPKSRHQIGFEMRRAKLDPELDSGKRIGWGGGQIE